MSKLVPIPGIRVKYRTEERNGRPTATATIWKDDEPLAEIATLDLMLVERPGDPRYQEWVDAVGAAFRDWLRRTTGIEGVETKRQKPRYHGEQT